MESRTWLLAQRLMSLARLLAQRLTALLPRPDRAASGGAVSRTHDGTAGAGLSPVGFSPGAEENPLGAWIGELVDENLRRHRVCRGDFAALRAAVAMVAPDRQLAITLRFDHGQLTIHDGMVGIPDVTLCGDYEVLIALASIPLTRIGRLPLPPLSSARRSAWRTTALELVSGELKVYGLLSHPRVLLRVLRLLCTV